MIPEEQRIAIAEGAKFGRLKVISRARQNNARNWIWLCLCDCGREKEVLGSDLKRGHTTSCGCFRKEVTASSKTVHGNARRHQHSAEYRAWRGILTRTTNPNSAFYDRYGGRGIKVCDRWIHSFGDFLSAVGPRPSSKHSIDRIDNDGNYEPGNVRWATASQQANNRTKRRWKKKPLTA